MVVGASADGGVCRVNHIGVVDVSMFEGTWEERVGVGRSDIASKSPFLHRLSQQYVHVVQVERLHPIDGVFQRPSDVVSLVLPDIVIGIRLLGAQLIGRYITPAFRVAIVPSCTGTEFQSHNGFELQEEIGLQSEPLGIAVSFIIFHCSEWVCHIGTEVPSIGHDVLVFV